MKRLALCVVLLLLSWGPGVFAQSYKCVLGNKCERVPCELITELKATNAFLRSLDKISAPVTLSKPARDQFYEQLKEDGDKRAQAYSSKCPAWGNQRLPKTVVATRSTTPPCAVGVKDATGRFQPITNEDLHKASAACSEIVEADFRKAEALSRRCELLPMTPTLAYEKDWLQEAATVKAASLRQSLRSYVLSCVPKADLSRQLSRLGLESLSKDEKPAYDKWQAKRASAARGK